MIPPSRARRLTAILALWITGYLGAWHILSASPVKTVIGIATRASNQQFVFSSPTPLPEPEREHDTLDSLDPRYRPFSPHLPPADLVKLHPTRVFPQRCLESWLGHGTLTGCTPSDLGDEEPLDIVWLWVNGSDARWEAEFIKHRTDVGIKSPVKHFREQNELVYSMRSVLAAMHGAIRTCHLALYDYAFNVSTDAAFLDPSVVAALHTSLGTAQSGNTLSAKAEAHLTANWRVAQTPTWIDWSKVNPSTKAPGSPGLLPPRSVLEPRLRFAGHSETYHLPTVNRDGSPRELGEAAWAEKEWRARALPTYNSMAIESRLGWLPGLADTAVAFNDDFFLLKPLSVSDFHSPLYGSVLRYKDGPHNVPDKLHEGLKRDGGENGGLIHANWLLSQRFPQRTRPGLAHVPKVITRQLQHEAMIMFDEACTSASSKKFREQLVGDGDVQSQWLQNGLRVERWREALLWTWAVAKHGNTADGFGIWGDVARGELERVLKVNASPVGVNVTIPRAERDTLKKGHVASVFEGVGWGVPQDTNYKFSSLDGHLPQTMELHKYPNCTIDPVECFGDFWAANESTTAAHMFKHITFRKPQCGDCVIMALVGDSGRLGLSSFFPPAQTTYTAPYDVLPPHAPGSPPHLPLTRTWQETDFSLDAVVSPLTGPGVAVDLREWTMRLLFRYMYTWGASHLKFEQLRNPKTAKKILLEDLDPKRGDKASVLCLNDDIEEGYDEVRDIVTTWFQKTWPDKVPWER